MDLRRTLLVAVGAAVCLLAGLPASADTGPAEVQAAAVAPAVQAAPAVPAVVQTPPPGAVGVPGSTTTIQTTHSHRGQPRSFVLHVPDGLLAPAPLVVALHAHSQEPKNIRAYSRLEALADEQGFVVAFPDGASGSWNAGLCCFPGSVDAVDDVSFLDEVLTLARARAPVDPSRISFTGGSNGAMMALRYACERPNVVAAVAVVAGPLVAPCPLKVPVPVLVLHGARDAVVPLNGGRNNKLNVTFPPVDRSLEPFRQAGGDVQLRVIPRAGHDWMTQSRHGVDATRTLWEFMRERRRELG